MTQGFIVDDKGRKMSKSLGDIITLDNVVKNLGAVFSECGFLAAILHST
jgi:isoleucyl-tRNA synthetase